VSARRAAGHARVAGLIAVVGVLATATAQLFYPPVTLDVLAGVIFTLAVMSFSGVGAFLVARVPGNRIGGLLLLAGTLLALGVFSAAYAQASLARGGGSWPATVALAWASDLLYIPPVVIVAAAVPAVYPDGRLPSRRWRWLPVAMGVGIVLASVDPALSPGPVNETLAVANPFGIPGIEPLVPIANGLASLVALPVLLGAVAAVIVRYRRGSTVERQQIRWLLAFASVAAIGFSIAFVAPNTWLANPAWVIGFSALAALPVGIGIAILRYRLYEIDRIISRTIGWAIVTGILVATFAVVVVGMQAAMAPVTQENTLAVAASTLVAAALFQPLQARVQRAVDRRFNRAPIDAARTVAAFAERTRDEVDLGRLTGETRDAAIGAVQPGTAQVWLRRVRG
jgi:hypothetical protein